MVIMLGLAAAVLYGTSDFLGGQATRTAGALAVLALAQTAGVIVALPAAAMSPGPVRLAALAWGVCAGLIGGAGLILFYKALAAGSGRALRYASAAGVSFGLYFLLIRNAGQSGQLWPVAAGRIGELAAVLIAAAALRSGPLL